MTDQPDDWLAAERERHGPVIDGEIHSGYDALLEACRKVNLPPLVLRTFQPPLDHTGGDARSYGRRAVRRCLPPPPAVRTDQKAAARPRCSTRLAIWAPSCRRLRGTSSMSCTPNAHSAHSQHRLLPCSPPHSATELLRAWHAAHLWNGRPIAHRSNRNWACSICRHTKTTTVETPSTRRMITARSSTLLPTPAIHIESSTG